jgi:uncharacterized protein (TIGR02466 family)
MKKEEYFKTPIWWEEKLDFVKSLNKASDRYIKESRKRNKLVIKETGDFGIIHPSTELLSDNSFWDFKNYIGKKSFDFLDSHGYDMNAYNLTFSEMWVQEFAKNGGGHHSAHIHWNQHVSGFYFLKASDKTSCPIFHEPRTGARSTKLKMKPELSNSLKDGIELINFVAKPGVLIIFPGYLEHQFTVDHGKEPFRFIHWNMTAIPKGVSTNA